MPELKFEDEEMVSISKRSEFGGARLKFILFMGVVILGAYIGYQMLPVLYHAYVWKDLMQHKVDVAATQGYPATWVNDQLKKSAAEYEIPPDAEIVATPQDQRIQVRVQYKKLVEFPGYTYEYDFDHTAKSTEFLAIK
jgi:hypothetical protein